MIPGPPTIKRRLMKAITVTTLTVLVLTCAVFITYEVVTFRGALARALGVRAGIIAANSTAALAFRDELDAREVLSSLRMDPHIESACLYDESGRVFATYPETAESGAFPIDPPRRGSGFERSHFVIFEPVVERDRWLGTLHIKSNLSAMQERYRFYSAMVLAVVLGSLALTFALSNSLARGISNPILELVAVAKGITERRDYSVRAASRGEGEPRVLGDAFNDMLREIQERDAQLERRVAERTAQLEATNKELEAFTYSVSHDLRAPLRSIDGFTTALVEDGGSVLDDRCRRHLARVRAATQRMGALIDDLLSLSRLSRAEMRRERVDLSALARQIAEELRQSQPERVVSIAIADGLIVEGDPQLLRVVVENLLRNAWKYTSKHDRAAIEMARGGNGARDVYHVRDDGAGFDMAHADLLFRPFQRLHSQTDFEGTGVGLATVQRIVERHGGRIWAEGNVERGATFYFTLWDRERT